MLQEIGEEVNRINAQPVQGEQSTMIEQEFESWVVTKLRAEYEYIDNADAFAKARGWTQPDLNEMETY